jgi:hypothetical protein
MPDVVRFRVFNGRSRVLAPPEVSYRTTDAPKKETLLEPLRPGIAPCGVHCGTIPVSPKNLAAITFRMEGWEKPLTFTPKGKAKIRDVEVAVVDYKDDFYWMGFAMMEGGNGLTCSLIDPFRGIFMPHPCKPLPGHFLEKQGPTP